PLASEVEEADRERGRGRKTGEGERRRRDQRLTERALREEGRVEKLAVARERVVACREQDEAGREEGKHERAGRDCHQQPAGLAQPPLNRDADRSLRPSGGRSPRRWPRSSTSPPRPRPRT